MKSSLKKTPILDKKSKKIQKPKIPKKPIESSPKPPVSKLPKKSKMNRLALDAKKKEVF